MIALLITLLVACIVCAVVYWIITLLPFPPPFKNIALVICALIFLVWLLGAVGLIPGHHWVVRY
jgi:hypothetical protein